jgi:hypothetical protein
MMKSLQSIALVESCQGLLADDLVERVRETEVWHLSSVTQQLYDLRQLGVFVSSSVKCRNLGVSYEAW